jgi:serine/threonine protein kinase
MRDRNAALDPLAFRDRLREQIAREAGGSPLASPGQLAKPPGPAPSKGMIVIGLTVFVLLLAALAIAAARSIPGGTDPSVARTAILSIVVGLVLLVAIVGVVVITVAKMLVRRSEPFPDLVHSDGYPEEQLPMALPAAVPVAGPRQCPICAATIPEDSPEGLCPKCVLGRCLGIPASPVLLPKAGETGSYGGPAPAPLPGELAAKFSGLEIQALLGQGGMGAVYKARQVKLDRTVAVKILSAEWGKDPAFAERFAREAKALARLSHPHIVAVHDFGESDGLFYLVMEYVDGANLRNILANGGLEPHEALAIVPQICDALQYAHEEGIIHRDIKPENILLDSKGRVKIADFGLAKLTNRPRATFTLTGSQQIMGTLDYMAPEQRLSPQQVDHRADIYSLGVVLYEMLTGELPLGRFAPPSSKARIDPRLDSIVFRALEREPGQRYQRISEIKTDLRAMAANEIPGATGGGQQAAGILNQVADRLLSIPITLGSVWDKQYSGLLRLEGENLILEHRSGYLRSRIKENVIAGKYLRRAELRTGWFHTSLKLQTASLKILSGIPTSEDGHIRIKIARRNAQTAADLVAVLGQRLPGLEIKLPNSFAETRGIGPSPERNSVSEPPTSPVRGKFRSLFNSVYTMFFSRAKPPEVLSNPIHERSSSQP